MPKTAGEIKTVISPVNPVIKKGMHATDKSTGAIIQPNLKKIRAEHSASTTHIIKTGRPKTIFLQREQGPEFLPF